MTTGRVGVTVVVPTCRRPVALRRCLRALAAQTGAPPFSVIVVDDAAGDDTGAVVDEAGRGLRVELLSLPGGPHGPATARNAGWRSARGEVLAFTDDDCVPEPGWLAAGVAALTLTDQRGVVQGRTAAPAGVEVRGLRDWWTWQVVDGPTPHFEGCNVFYRRAALEATGGFDESIPWPWGEDAELGWSVLDRGWERSFAPDAVVRHPVERRGFRWYLRTGLRDTTLVGVATRHPGFRAAAYWRPWAYRRSDVALLLAAGGIVASRWWRPAALATLPYAWWQRPSVRQPHFLRLCLQVPAVDAARIAGQVRGAVLHRTFVV